MRPERSVRHSPRLTKMKGVETRMAPASMASGTLGLGARRAITSGGVRAGATSPKRASIS